MSALLRPGSDVPAPEPAGGWAATAFGLEIEAAFPVPGLDDLGSTGAGSPVSLGLMPLERLQGLWRSGEAETVVRSEVPAMTLDHHPALGYLLDTADFGSYLLARDGSLVRCAPPPADNWRWQRFLTGHVLPLAALLAQFEVFHASAVRLGDRVLAFVGASGAGKSSLALRLVMGGATLFTDDVLVLRAEDERVVAHPGAGVVNLRHAEHELLREAGAELGAEIGRDAKGVRLRMARDGRPGPLTAMYFLDRESPGPGPRFRRIDEVDPARLLGATYNFAIRTPERLLNQLDVCARLAADVEMYEVSCPPPVGAAALAVEIAAHSERH